MFITNQRKDLLDKWAPFIMESRGAQEAVAPMSEAKQFIIAQIAHNKQFIMEGYSASTPSTNNGVGAVALPADPGSYSDFYDPTRKVGSGDPAISILGLSISAAAHTVAFDLVPVVPIHSELAILEYVDSIYAGGRFDSAAKPKFVKVTNALLFADASLVSGAGILIYGDNGQPAMKCTFIQYARLEKAIIVKVDATGTYAVDGETATFTTNTAITLNQVVSASKYYAINVAGTGETGDYYMSGDAMGSLTINFVNPNDDHVRAASAYGNIDGEPVNRETSEGGTDITLELKTYTKSVQAKTYTIFGKATRQQVRMFKAKGLDAVPLVKRAMQNEITQSINDDIIERMRKLGVTTHANLYAAQGANFNLFVGPASTATKAMTAFNSRPMIDARNVNRTAEFGNITNAESNSSAENLYSRQARIRSRILAASAFVGNVSRFGSADAAVVNSQLLGAIKESGGWQPSQVSNTLTQSTKALYFAGTIGDVKIYCNPKWNWSDTTVVVARTNKSATGADYEELNQGIVFCPHDLASNVDIISEGDMSPKFLIESVYAIAETGIHPNLAYLTFGFHSDFGMLG